MSKEQAEKVREPLDIDDGCSIDCRRSFRVMIENQLSYGYSYDQSYLCDECKMLALEGAIKILRLKIKNCKNK